MSGSWLPLKQAAKHYGITEHGIRQRVYAGKLKSKGHGRGRLFYVNGEAGEIDVPVTRRDGMTLLEKAKAVNPGRKKRPTTHSEDELALALAYARGEINDTQVSAAVNMRRSNTRFWAGGVLIRAIAAGVLVRK